MKLEPSVAWLVAITFIYSICFFSVDIVVDIQESLFENKSFSMIEWFHIVMETTAVFGLSYSLISLYHRYKNLKRRDVERQQTLEMMRGRFDHVLHQRFDSWGLTAAERDVALLIIRGLNVSDIAAARKTAPGTVKAQSTAIFRKIGVGSKAELLSAIIDEFLENSPTYADTTA